MPRTVLDAEDAKIRVYGPVGETDIEADKLQAGAAGQEKRWEHGSGRRMLQELGDADVNLKVCCTISDLRSCKIVADLMAWREGPRAGVLRKAFIIYRSVQAGTLVFTKTKPVVLLALLA